MKLQNIVLLGFVSSAVEYLNEQFNNDEIGQYLKGLNATELEKLRSELNARLESSIGVMNNTVETLMKTGSAAFLDFINDEENSTMLNELLSDKQEEQAETDEFLSIIAKAAEEANAFEESAGDLMEEVKPEVSEEELDAIFSEIVENEPSGQQSASDDEMVDELLKELKSQLEEKEEELVEEDKDPTPELFADALSALMSQNDSIEKYLEELAALEDFVNENEEEAEETEEPVKEPGESLDDILMEVEGAFEGLFSDDEAIEESLKEDIVSFMEEETPAEEVEEPAAEEPEAVEEPAEVEPETVETEPETVKEAPVEETAEPETLEEETSEPETEEPVNEEAVQQEYVSDLIEELKRKLAAEEAAKKKVPTVEDIYQSISELYPHLSRSFIRSVYDLKEPIASTYPLNRRVIVLHRLVFTNVDNLRAFVESVLDNNYTVNVDERKMLVDTFKEHNNTDGKILTNIFEISNLAKGLGGDYEGYRVIVKEDE